MGKKLQHPFKNKAHSSFENCAPQNSTSQQDKARLGHPCGPTWRTCEGLWEIQGTLEQSRQSTDTGHRLLLRLRLLHERRRKQAALWCKGNKLREGYEGRMMLELWIYEKIMPPVQKSCPLNPEIVVPNIFYGNQGREGIVCCPEKGHIV